jgi:ribonuclease P protein component
MTKPFAFPLSERLKKRSEIATLIASGKICAEHPLRMVFMTGDHDGVSNIRVAFAVSKKKFSSAVKRNLLKRRMREAYRLNSSSLKQELLAKRFTCAVMFQYVGKEVLAFKAIQDSMVKLLSKIEIPE